MSSLLRPAAATPCGVVGPPSSPHVLTTTLALDVHPHALRGVPGAWSRDGRPFTEHPLRAL